MSSIIDRCMEDEEERARMKKASEVEVMPAEEPCDSDNINNPFCYNPGMSCPCKLDLQECLLQNTKAKQKTGTVCEYFFDRNTGRQEWARQKCINDLRAKAQACSALLNAVEKNKTIVEKSISGGCLGCGCLLGAAFIVFMASCGFMVFKWSCNFLSWVVDKF